MIPSSAKKAVALVSEHPAIGSWIEEHRVLCEELDKKSDAIEQEKQNSFSKLQTILFEMGKITAEEREGDIGFDPRMGVVYLIDKSKLGDRCVLI